MGPKLPTRHSPAKAARRAGIQPAYAGQRVELVPDDFLLETNLNQFGGCALRACES